jgi:pimeloyl-ACP methyl ester carboxylesterase
MAADVTPTSHAFDAHGTRLVVHDWGGDGAPVLLAHPTGFHGRIWAPVARRLVAAHRRVYSFDFRGHGDSDAPDIEHESYSWHGFADDVFAVARHLELMGREDLLAAGHSKGGAALLLAEAKTPGTFARIWAYEPIVFPAEAPLPAQEEFGMAQAARRRRNEWPSVDAAFDSYASKPPLNVMTDDSLRAYVDYGLRDRGDGVFVLRCRPEVEARIYAMGPNHGAFGLLQDIEAPVHVVCGETSSDISPAFGARIAVRLPRGSLEVMIGCGHFGPQQDPNAAVASMLAFAATRA